MFNLPPSADAGPSVGLRLTLGEFDQADLANGGGSLTDPKGATTPTRPASSDTQAEPRDEIRVVKVLTLLLTDLEGSTKWWEEYAELMPEVMLRHDQIISRSVADHAGEMILAQGEGDSAFAVFEDPVDAVLCAIQIQLAIKREEWPDPIRPRIRVGLHTGEVEVRGHHYFGRTVNRCARLRSVAYGGQILISKATADELEDRLPKGARLHPLGRHRLRDLFMPEEVFELSHSELHDVFPPIRSLNTLPNNLPVQLTSFIGREAEVADIIEKLRVSRLITLAGPGGAGKTRLAVQVGADVLDRYREGVWFVELATCHESGLVLPAFTFPLGVIEEPGQPLVKALMNRLAERQALLIADNVEHVLEDASELIDKILRRCPQVSILATSREPLGINGELVIQVPPLAVPPRDAFDDCRRLQQYGAVGLFVERARAVNPAFDLNLDNSRAIAAISSQLDGIPLAIELAAAWANVLTPAQIEQRLKDRFGFLSSTARKGPARQQTLRAAVDWSYERLEPSEQDFFVRLGVFRGGFDLEAAEKVCASVSDKVLQTLTGLVSKSLVTADATGETARYSLLETVRQYALQKLADQGLENEIHSAHLSWCIGLAALAESNLHGPHAGRWLERLELEHDNFRSAIKWALGKSPEEALALSATLWHFWWIRGYLSEGLRWLERSIEASEKTPSTLRASAINAAGVLSQIRGDVEKSRAFFEKSLEMRRNLGDEKGIASSLNNLGNMTYRLGDYETAKSMFAESIDIQRKLNDPRGISISLLNLGNVVFQLQDYNAAREYYEESLVIKRKIGEQQGIASSLHNLGIVAHAEGKPKEARDLYQQSLQIRRDLGDKRGICASLHSIGELERKESNWAESRQAFSEGLAIAKDIGDKAAVIACVEGIAALAARLGAAQTAILLYGACAALRAETRQPIPPSDEADHEADIASARLLLSESEFARHWEEGQTLSSADLAEVALRFELPRLS